jgi:hypothetical protein
MRRVKYKIRGNTATAATEGQGYFHGFHADSIESRDGNMNYTVALVEREDGSMKKIDPEDIVFLTPNPTT